MIHRTGSAPESLLPRGALYRNAIPLPRVVHVSLSCKYWRHRQMEVISFSLGIYLVAIEHGQERATNVQFSCLFTRGVNLLWKLEASWILKIQHTAAHIKGLRVSSSSEIVIQLYTNNLFPKSRHFGRCSHLIIMYIILNPMTSIPISGSRDTPRTDAYSPYCIQNCCSQDDGIGRIQHTCKAQQTLSSL